MTPIRANELEILLSQSRGVFEELIAGCVQSSGDLHAAEIAMEVAINSLRSVIVTVASRVCVVSGNRDFYCPECGWALTRWGTEDRSIVTRCGEGRFPSERYRCRGCKTDHYPWQMAHGLDEKNRITLEARRLIAQEAADGSFEKSSVRLKRMGIDISPSEADCTAREVGEWRKQEQEAVRTVSCQSGQVLSLTLHDWSCWPETPLDDDVVVFSVDGAHVRSNEAGPKGLEWFEVRTGMIRLSSPTDPRRTRKICVAGIMEPDKLFEMLRSQWWQAPVSWNRRMRRMVFVADGAEWIWNRVKWYFPRCLQILDIYHCAQHVGSAARAAWGPSGEHVRRWVEGAIPWLLEQNGPTRIIRALIGILRSGRAIDKEQLETEIRYLLKHRHRMRYYRWRAEGLPIGSGAVESTIKQVSTQRLGAPGMMWTKNHADLMLHLRSAVLSESLHLTVERERRIRINRAMQFNRPTSSQAGAA
jgi:hypothetical protein